MSFTIKYNPDKNRIVITVKKIDMSNADQYIEELTQAMELTRPGWSGYTDVTEASVLTQDVAAKMAPTMELAVSKGLSTTKKWAYVTNNPIYKMQWKRMFQNNVEYCETCEEAEEYLDRP